MIIELSNPTEARNAIKYVIRALRREENHKLSRVRLEPIGNDQMLAIASDGLRMHIAGVACDAKACDVTPSSCDLLAYPPKAGPAFVSSFEVQDSIGPSDDEANLEVIEDFGEPYPDWKARLCKSVDGASCVFDVPDMGRVAKAAKSQMKTIKTDGQVVSLEITDSKLTCKIPDGQSVEVVSSGHAEGPASQIDIRIGFLIDALSGFGKAQAKLQLAPNRLDIVSIGSAPKRRAIIMRMKKQSDK